VTGNGFSVRTLAGNNTEMLDAVVFTLAYCATVQAVGDASAEVPGVTLPLACKEEDWKVVTSSKCLWTMYSTKCVEVDGGEFDTSKIRDFEHVFNLEINWFYAFSLLLRVGLVVVGNCGTVVLAVAGRVQTARRFLGMVVYVMNGIVNGVIMGFMMASQENGAGPIAAIYPIGGSVLIGFSVGFVVLFQESYVFRYHLFAVGWVGMLCCAFFDGFVTYKGNSYWLLSNFVDGWWSEIMLMLMFWSLVTGSRLWISHQAWRDIQPDLLKYLNEWRRLNDDDESRSSLKNLAQVSTEIAVQITRNFNDEHLACIQQTFHRQAKNGLPVNVTDPFARPLGSNADGVEKGRGGRRYTLPRWDGPNPSHLNDTVRPLSLNSLRGDLPRVVVSMDQLYLQAQLIWPFFLESFKKWVAASNCHCTTQFSGVYVLGSEAFGNSGERLIKWSSVKGVARSIEKVSRAYNNKVSRLVDVVRQNVICDNVSDIIACLEAIQNDSDAHIVRIKNRLHDDYQASNLTAGYRDVAVNVLVVTPDTLRLGLAGHVCEVQLILRQIHLIKTEEGHKSYVAFRNKRAE